MSKIIRSNRVNLSEASYKLSSDVFISKEKYLSKGESARESDEPLGAENSENKNQDYSPGSLIEKAETAAIEIMDNAQALADELIADARNSARELEQEALESANAMYENAKRKGKEEGFQEGFDEGYSKGAKEAEGLLKQSNVEYEKALEMKRALEVKTKEFFVDKEAEMIKLVLAITKKIIGKEITNIEYIESLIREAMSHLNYATEIVLRVSEQDYDSAVFAKPKILAMAERIEKLDIKIDYALDRGSCIIDTDTGSIDASVKTQLEGIETLFNNILMANQSEKEEAENDFQEEHAEFEIENENEASDIEDVDFDIKDGESGFENVESGFENAETGFEIVEPDFENVESGFEDGEEEERNDNLDLPYEEAAFHESELTDFHVSQLHDETPEE